MKAKPGRWWPFRWRGRWYSRVLGVLVASYSLFSLHVVWEFSNDDVQNTSSLGAQIAAAFLIVFAVEGRRVVHPSAVREGLLVTYLALPLLITGTLASGFVARTVLSLGLGALAAALFTLLWVGGQALEDGAAEQEADARLRYRLAGFLDRHR